MKSLLNSTALELFVTKAEHGVCSHAYIVDGGEGVGKLDFALECAKVLLCENAKKPCGYCPSCLKSLSGTHPDIFVIGRDKPASIADVRELIRRASLKPNDGERQVFIVNNAGKLRADAQNALLKLFEEPPESVTVFLLTESRSSLLPTVLSRGQSIHLDGMTDEEMYDILAVESGKVSRRDIVSAIAEAQGSLGRAKRLLSPERAKTRAEAVDIMSLALGGKRYEIITRLVTPKYKREQLTAILEEVMGLSSAVLKGLYDAPCRSERERDAVYMFGDVVSKRALSRMSEVAVRCIESLDANANVTSASSKLAIDLLTAGRS